MVTPQPRWSDLLARILSRLHFGHLAMLIVPAGIAVGFWL